MTIYTAEEIEALEKSLDYSHPGPRDSSRVVIAAQTYLQLITGKHPDYCVVKREGLRESFEQFLSENDHVPLNAVDKITIDCFIEHIMAKAAQEGKE